MFELNCRPYCFESAPDGRWLPSPWTLFDNEDVEPESPGPDEIEAECRRFWKNWTQRERELRQIRSEMAIRTGVCRNR